MTSRQSALVLNVYCLGQFRAFGYRESLASPGTQTDLSILRIGSCR